MRCRISSRKSLRPPGASIIAQWQNGIARLHRPWHVILLLAHTVLARWPRILFGGVPVRRVIAAADMATDAAKAKMHPGRSHHQALLAALGAGGDAADQLHMAADIVTHLMLRACRRSSFGPSAPPPSWRLAISEAGLALPDFDNIAIGISDIAARLAVFLLWLGDELRSSAAP